MGLIRLSVVLDPRHSELFSRVVFPQGNDLIARTFLGTSRLAAMSVEVVGLDLVVWEMTCVSASSDINGV